MVLILTKRIFISRIIKIQSIYHIDNLILFGHQFHNIFLSPQCQFLLRGKQIILI